MREPVERPCPPGFPGADGYNLKLVFASGGRRLSGVDVEIRKPGGERWKPEDGM